MLSRRPIKRGIEAGLAASVPQVLLPKAEERLRMRRGEDANLGPRFIERLARLRRARVREDTKWLAAWAFHFGYAAVWGAVYAVAYQRWRPHPLLGGTALGTVIYAIAFPHWGGAVLTRTEAWLAAGGGARHRGAPTSSNAPGRACCRATRSGRPLSTVRR